MKIVGIFDTNEQKVGYRLAGIRTFLVNNTEDISNVWNLIKSKSDVRNYCI